MPAWHCQINNIALCNGRIKLELTRLIKHEIEHVKPITFSKWDMKFILVKNCICSHWKE